MGQCIMVHGHNDGYKLLYSVGGMPTKEPCAEFGYLSKEALHASGYMVELNEEGAWISIGQMRRDASRDNRVGIIFFSIFVHHGHYLPHVKAALDKALATYDELTGHVDRVVIPENWQFIDRLSELLAERSTPQSEPWLPEGRMAAAKIYLPDDEIASLLEETSLPRFSLYRCLFIVPKVADGTAADPVPYLLGEQCANTPDISQEISYELQLRERARLPQATPAVDENVVNVRLIYTLGKSRYVSPGRTEFICSNPEVSYNEVTQVISYPKELRGTGIRFTLKFRESYRPCSGMLDGGTSMELPLTYSKRGKFTYYKPVLIGLAALLAVVLAIVIVRSIDFPEPAKQSQSVVSTPTKPANDDAEHPINADDNPGPNDSVGWAVKNTLTYLETEAWSEDSLQKYYNLLNRYDKNELLDVTQAGVKERVYCNLLFRHALNQNMITKGLNCMEDLANSAKFPQMEAQLGPEKYRMLQDLIADNDMRRRLARNRGDIIKSDFAKVKTILYGK